MNSHRNRTLPLGLIMVLTAALLLSVAPPVSAGGFGFQLGAGFRIGPVNFRIALGGHDTHRRGYYYRTSHALNYRGARCNDRCFRDRGHTYHDTRCPLLSAHFRHNRVHPGAIFDTYAPRDGYYGYDTNGRYDGHDRYDRNDRHRSRDYRREHGSYDDHHDRSRRRHRRGDDHYRYDRRHRRGHSHDDSCDRWRHRSYDN